MAHLQEMIEKYGNLVVDEQEFKKMFDIKEPKVWLPEYDETFYWVNERGHISEEIYNSSTIADSIVRNNPVFKTREETDCQAEKNRFLIKMERDFLENSEPIDWEDHEQRKLYMWLNHGNNKIKAITVLWGQGKDLYTTNREWLERYIQENEADIKRYYFGVEE